MGSQAVALAIVGATVIVLVHATDRVIRAIAEIPLVPLVIKHDISLTIIAPVMLPATGILVSRKKMKFLKQTVTIVITLATQIADNQTRDQAVRVIRFASRKMNMTEHGLVK